MDKKVKTPAGKLLRSTTRRPWAIVNSGKKPLACCIKGCRRVALCVHEDCGLEICDKHVDKHLGECASKQPTVVVLRPGE